MVARRWQRIFKNIQLRLNLKIQNVEHLASLIQRLRGRRLERATSFKKSQYFFYWSMFSVKKMLSRFKSYVRNKKIHANHLETLERQMQHVLGKLKAYTTGWLPEWERLSHNAEDGFVGSLDGPSLKRVGAITKYVISLSGLPENKFNGFELEMGFWIRRKGSIFVYHEWTYLGMT